MKLMMLSGSLNHITEADLFSNEDKKTDSLELETPLTEMNSQFTVSKKISHPQPIRSGNIDALIKRGILALEDGDWDDAENFFDSVLNMDAENAAAYLGLAMATYKCVDLSAFKNYYIQHQIELREDKYLRRAKRFADERLSALLYDLDSEVGKLEERLAAIRSRIAPAQNLISGWYAGFHAISSNSTVSFIGQGAEYQVFDYSKFYNTHADRLCSEDIKAIVGGHVILRHDGTVAVIRDPDKNYENSDVNSWTDILQISGPDVHLVGLKTDGTVVSTGKNTRGQCDTMWWNNIVKVAACLGHTIGLQTDGTLVTAGNNRDGACDVESWSDICDVVTSPTHTVGLRKNGTVVATTARRDKKDPHYCGESDTEDWSNIVAIACSLLCTIGLKADGTVIATGYNNYGQCNVSHWHNIVAIACTDSSTIGLCDNGRILIAGKPFDSDSWEKLKLFDSLDSIEKEHSEIGKKVREAARQRYQEVVEANKHLKAELSTEKNNLQKRLSSLNGIFKAKQRQETERRIAEIDKILLQIYDY